MGKHAGVFFGGCIVTGALEMTSAMESFQIFAAARESAGKAWL
jgi:K+ transporter